MVMNLDTLCDKFRIEDIRMEFWRKRNNSLQFYFTAWLSYADDDSSAFLNHGEPEFQRRNQINQGLIFNKLQTEEYCDSFICK